MMRAQWKRRAARERLMRAQLEYACAELRG